MNTNLVFENSQALILQQALLGAISENVRLITFQVDEGCIVVNCIIENESKSDQEEFEDLISEIEALQSKPINIDVKVKVSKETIFLNQVKGRPIFFRKEPQ